MAGTEISGKSVADRALLVSMSVEALVVPSGPVTAVRLAPRLEFFGRLKLGAQLRPEPWESSTDLQLEEGVHLHWKLPAALAHGLSPTGPGGGPGASATDPAQKGRIEFPPVPDRWLVLRVAAQPAQSRAWVVRSNEIVDGTGPNAILTLADPPRAGEATKPRYVVRNIGKKYGYDEPWERASTDPGVELTAVSAGNPIFAAFYPGCRNVFGLHDDLAGLDEGTLLYFVVGWYSRPREDDPLSSACARPDHAQRVKAQWGIERFSSEPESIPTRTVCHGTVYGVRWKRKGTSEPIGAPAYRVAVGNTAVEALSALVAAPAERGRLWEPLLSAFQYGALGDRDPGRGMPEIDADLHRRRFQPVDGGTQWLIQRVESDPTTAENDPRPSFPADKDVAVLYSDLDGEQRTYDRLAREVASLRDEAHAAWFRSKRPRERNVEALTKLFGSLATEIAAATSKLLSAQQEVRRLCGKLHERGIRIPRGAGDGTPPARPEFELVAAPMPWFWRANDPAILVATPGVARPHRYDSRRPVTCRVLGEVVSALRVSMSALDASLHGEPVTAALEATSLPIAAKARSAMPFDEIAALFRESLLFDPARASDIAASAYRQVGSAQRPGSTAISTLAQKIRDALGRDPRAGDEIRPIGVHPDGAMTSWEPSWDPLFMFWEVAWAPASTGPASSDLLRQWELRDNTEYRPAAGAGDQPAEARRYLGWATLSLDLSRQIQERLEAAPEIASAFASWGMLTQTTGGLHDALVTREHGLQLPPLLGDGTVDDQVANVLGGARSWSPLGSDSRGRAGFFPVRAGHLGVLRLWLIDGFGRAEKVIDSNEPATLTAAESLRREDGTSGPWIALPPRIAQPARLLFRWRSADRRESNADPATSPVIGWIIPDHLDKGLLVCDARGRIRGELRRTTQGVSWSAAPGFADGWDSVRSLADVPDLRSFADGVRTAGGPALDGLLELIERISMSITTTGAAAHAQGPSVFTGQPLALARASLTLEVWGRPATDQGTPAPSTGGIGSARFPVRLGDMRKSGDGLIGYFVGGDQRLRAAFGATPPSSPSYFAGSDLEVSLDGGTVDVTLLLDPRAAVHVCSGIFPAQVLELPGYVADAVDDLQCSVRVGPVLGDRDTLRLPVPDIGGEWAWVDRDRDRAQVWAESGDVAKADTGAPIPKRPLIVRDGWLSFKPGDRRTH